jgi:hypothetical protein
MQVVVPVDHGRHHLGHWTAREVFEAMETAAMLGGIPELWRGGRVFGDKGHEFISI